MSRPAALPLLLAAVAALVLAAAGFVSHAPNRIVPGSSVIFLAAVSPVWLAAVAGALLVLAATTFVPPRVRALWQSAASALLAVALLAAAGSAARSLAVLAPPAARTSLGGGFWLAMAAAGLAWLDAGAGRHAQAGRLVVGALALAGCFGLAVSGGLDALSVAREYASRADVFSAELLRHLAIAGGATLVAAIIGIPLGMLAFGRPPEGVLLSGLSLLQTIPSIALFGLMIGPLAALATAVPALQAWGVSGIGWLPAVIALVLYALLPLVRNVLAGLAAAPVPVVDAAHGNGMRPGEVMRLVRLPLAAGVIVAGLRVALVQSIGLTTVAALIGAGGLGTFVFQGLGQNALDLVLLGVLPVLAVALAADALLGALARAVSPA